MTEIAEEPPEETEVYEQLDEELDEEDLPGHFDGPDGARDLDVELTADQVALAEAGANLDDPDRLLMLQGGMDDPDGSGLRGPRADELPTPAAEDVALEPGDDIDADLPGLEVDADDAQAEEGDGGLEVVALDATDLDQIPDDAPGPDAAAW